jgi:hypothetical protein
MISRFFRTPRNPGQMPVTDACVAPNKVGTGILIRRCFVRKRKRSSCCDDNVDDNVKDRKDPSTTTVTIGKKKNEFDSNNGDNDNNDDDNNDDNDSNSNSNSNIADNDKGSAAEKEKDETTKQQPLMLYFPRPGDVCVIRYDCYVLSPLATTRDRHGRLRIAEAQQLQPRKRTWVDGNFEEPFETETTTVGNGSQQQQHEEPSTSSSSYQRYRDTDRYNRDDPNGDGNGEDNNNTALGLPALEFEIGVGDVVRGLEVVVQRMVEGEIVEATIPHLYGYGYRGLWPRIPPRTDLVFVVKLEKVIPSAASNNAVNALEGNNNNRNRSNSNNGGRGRTLALFCLGFLEGSFFVMLGVAIPVLLLLRSELGLNEIVRDMATLVM